MKNKNLKKKLGKKQIVFSLVVFLMFNPMLMQFWWDSEKPKYISIDENRDYIWNTTFKKKPLTDMYIDSLDLDEETAEILTDAYFEIFSFSESTLQWKAEPIFLSAEKDQRINGIKTDYVDFIYKLSKFHKINDETGRKTIDKWVKIRVYEYKYELYRDNIIAWMVFGEETSPYLARNFFIANNVNWNEVVEEINKEIDTDAFNIKVETVNFGDEVGFSVLYLNEDVEEFKDLKLTIKYNEGIMYYLRLSYNYETIYEFSLDGYTIFFMENWIMISMLSVFVFLIALIFIIIHRKRGK